MKVAACVIVRNEERVIAEWIAWHEVVGFDTLIIYDNLSTDRTVQATKALSRMLDVRLIDWPETGPAWQTSAYDHALVSFEREFDWIAFVDSDEFIFPLGSTSIRSMLEVTGVGAAVAIPWMMFGSSHHEVRTPHLVTEVYNWRSEHNFGPNRHVKSIVRPSEVEATFNPHCFTLKGEAPGSAGRYVDPTGAPITWTGDRPGLLSEAGPQQGARVNHYFVKSRAEWERKVARGYNGTDARASADFEAYDQNVVRDTTADPYVRATKQTLRRANLGIFSDLPFE